MSDCQFTEMFERADLISNGKVNVQKLIGMKISHIIDLCEQSLELTLDSNIKPTDTIFSHSASLSLGGSRTPCASFSCRSKRLKELMQFSAIYSDRVYIDNFIVSHIARAKTRSQAKVKEDLKDDLQLILQMKPMLEAGIVVPVVSRNTCGYCMAMGHCEDKSDVKCSLKESGRLSELQTNLNELFDCNTKSHIVKQGSDLYKIRCTGPEHLIHDGTISFDLSKKRILKSIGDPKFLDNLKKHKSIELSDDLREKLNLHRQIAGEHLDTIIFETSISKSLNSTYLSEVDLHIEMINKYFATNNTHKLNNIIRKHMTSLLPFLDGINSNEIMDLRKNDGDSFILFRNELNKVIKTHLSSVSDDFTDRDAIEIYSEFLLPELSKINKAIAAAEKTLSKGIFRKITAVTGALSFGFFSGYIPQLPAVVSPLFNAIAGVQEWAMNQSDFEESVKDNNMYFLWKVKKLSKD